MSMRIYSFGSKKTRYSRCLSMYIFNFNFNCTICGLIVSFLYILHFYYYSWVLYYCNVMISSQLHKTRVFGYLYFQLNLNKEKFGQKHQTRSLEATRIFSSLPCKYLKNFNCRYLLNSFINTVVICHWHFFLLEPPSLKDIYLPSTQYWPRIYFFYSVCQYVVL